MLKAAIIADCPLNGRVAFDRDKCGPTAVQLAAKLFTS
jgi:hypothetical protein